MVDPGFLRDGGANPPGGANIRFCQIFTKNCMKLKQFGPQSGEGVRVSHAPLDLSLQSLYAIIFTSKW